VVLRLRLRLVRLGDEEEEHHRRRRVHNHGAASASSASSSLSSTQLGRKWLLLLLLLLLLLALSEVLGERRGEERKDVFSSSGSTQWSLETTSSETKQMPVPALSIEFS